MHSSLANVLVDRDGFVWVAVLSGGISRFGGVLPVVSQQVGQDRVISLLTAEKPAPTRPLATGPARR